MTEHQPTPDADAFAGFDRALGAAVSAHDAWDALYRLTDRTIGAKLFTTMVIDNERKVAGRAFTSDPAAYPVSGTKPLRYDAWFDLVHGQRKPFVANTLAEIATVFPDHALIGSLGCGSVINLPIEIGGKVVGTLNALDAEHHYDPARVAAAERLRLPAKAAWLAAHWLGRAAG
jgi:hypothetical protein